MPELHDIEVNGIRMHFVREGEGPLVILLHGWPETWYSWRHQISVLAAAGYQVVAPDQRGFGRTQAPADVEQYTMLHAVGDVIGLVQVLGEESAVVVGHDWGAPVAWNAAMMRPDVVRGVVGLSVPPTPRHPYLPPLESARRHFGERFYQIYFQKAGVAEAELGKDPVTTFRKVLAGGTGSAALVLEPGAGLLDGMIDPEVLPGWLTAQDIEVFAAAYERSGFTGGLNWYRNIDRSWELMAPWQGAPITPPAMFLIGDRDPVRPYFALDTLDVLSDLRETVEIEDAEHWTQQERPEQVNAALLRFLGGL